MNLATNGGRVPQLLRFNEWTLCLDDVKARQGDVTKAVTAANDF